MEKEGFPKDQLLITGNPYFEYFANNHKYNIAQSVNLIKQYDLKKYQKVFLFASEPITTIFGERKGMEIYGYTELTILYHIVDYIKSQPSESIKLLIKPHPKDNIEVFSSLISQYSFISFSEEISTNYFDLLNTCDLVLGMSSTLLLEAALLNKNILSVQIGLIMDSPFVLDKMGISASVKNTVELTRKLDAMNDGSLRVNLLSYLTEHSVNNILQYINKMLK
jgi:UDP-N-acetylglucosamine 2-epimerase